MRQLFLLLLPCLSFGENPPTICVELGGACYLGSWKNSSNDTRFASFQGVRYAKSPINDLRFKAPELFQSGEALWDVSGDSMILCPQPALFEKFMIGVEDCLFLNIYVPETVFTNAATPLPVMFWIHGGSLLYGSNGYQSQGPKHLMDKGMIVVTINYRLGPLGFLSLGTTEVPGNAGLWDQQVALTWVNENIASFGGDPSSITIFGESAGSLSIALHILSPKSEGLFQRAILQSGTAIDPSWGPTTQEHAQNYASMFIEKLGCDHEKDVLACLQQKDVNEIVDLTDMFEMDNVWMPVPDGDFLPDDADALLKMGEFNKDVDIMIGTNADEGILYVLDQLANPSLWDDYVDLFAIDGPRYLFNIVLPEDVTEEDKKKANELAEFYVGPMDNLDEYHKQEIFDMFTDAGFLYGTRKTIDYFLAQNMTVYEYILTYQGEFSLSEVFGVSPEGVCHGDDLLYLWDPVSPLGNISQPLDLQVRESVVSAWTNFATFGNPTPPGSNVLWEPSDVSHNYWNISGLTPSMGHSVEIDKRMEKWHQVVG